MNRLLVLLMISSIISCTDNIETLDGLGVSLTTPSDDAVFTDPIVNFYWYPVEGASEYRLLVSDSTESLIVDTVLYSNSFKKSLENGIYLLQVQASNIISTTASPFIKFTVDKDYLEAEGNDLNGDFFNSFFPHDGAILTSTLVRFDWNHLPNADMYTIKVSEFTEDNATILVIDTAIEKSNFHLYMNPGNYIWQVEASNESAKRISNQFAFAIDTASLKADFTSFTDTVSLFYPTDSVVYKYYESIELGWTSSNTPYAYEVLIAFPSFEKPIWLITPQSAFNRLTLQPYQLDTGQYQWAVRSSKTNNLGVVYFSDLSEIRTFFVEP